MVKTLFLWPKRITGRVDPTAILPFPLHTKCTSMRSGRLSFAHLSRQPAMSSAIAGSQHLLCELLGAVWTSSGSLIQVIASCRAVALWCLRDFGGQLTEEVPMLKLTAAVATALFVTTSPLAYAQTASTAQSDHPSAADLKKLTDLRVDLIKAALQMKPDQTKLWPPVENAIRARAEGRQARLAKIRETMGKRADESRSEVLENRDPIAFMQRRAEALSQRSADLNKLAEAWQPLYKTLSPEQRKRMAALAIFVFHDMSNAIERRHAETDEDD